MLQIIPNKIYHANIKLILKCFSCVYENKNLFMVGTLNSLKG